MKRQFSILWPIFLLLALCACGAARQPSRLPDPEEVKALLVQLVDMEMRAPGIVVELIMHMSVELFFYNASPHDKYIGWTCGLLLEIIQTCCVLVASMLR